MTCIYSAICTTARSCREYIYIYRPRKDLVSRKVAIYSEDSQRSQGRKHVGVYWTRRIGMVGGVPEGARDK